jgi:penicillin-binding protein 1A
MTTLMRDVVRYGTAARAMSLGRQDLAGKTGTTNDYVDAWFCGYQPALAAVAWIGFDQPKKLGNGETGSAAALPIWIGYMEKALKGVPETFMEQPPGLVNINAVDPGSKESVREFIYKEHLPPPEEIRSTPQQPMLTPPTLIP